MRVGSGSFAKADPRTVSIRQLGKKLRIFSLITDHWRNLGRFRLILRFYRDLSRFRDLSNPRLKLLFPDSNGGMPAARYRWLRKRVFVPVRLGRASFPVPRRKSQRSSGVNPAGRRVERLALLKISLFNHCAAFRSSASCLRSD